jgi:Ca2+-binding EF-hand superfamily protein
METITLKANAQLLEKKIKELKGKFTLNDAAAITGVPTEQARESLNELMGKYLCHLQVSENGDLIYDFGTSPTRRGEKTFAEILEGIKNWLWKAFVVFFKAWITVTLVVYFAVFVSILILMIIGMTASNKDDNKRSSGDTGAMLRLISDIFYAIFRWNTIQNYQDTYYERDRYGQPYKHYKPVESTLFNTKARSPKAKKNFISSVYDFVFGPPRVETEPFENQKEVAAYARQNKGIMVLPEFKALAGWEHTQAQEFMTDCIARFNGSAEISNNGVLYADFYDLTRSKTQNQDGKIEWYWNEYEPEYELTGNTTGRNAWIIFINAFNLLFASFFTFNPEFREMIGGDEFGAVVFYGLGVVPFMFSMIFFAVPILRYFNILPKRRKRRINNIRKRLVKVIYQKGVLKNLSLDEILTEVNAENAEKLSKPEIEKMMNELVVDWQGNVVLNDSGSVGYEFHQLRYELEEARNLRQNRKDDGRNLGNIYLDTGKL